MGNMETSLTRTQKKMVASAEDPAGERSGVVQQIHGNEITLVKKFRTTRARVRALVPAYPGYAEQLAKAERVIYEMEGTAWTVTTKGSGNFQLTADGGMNFAVRDPSSPIMPNAIMADVGTDPPVLFSQGGRIGNLTIENAMAETIETAELEEEGGRKILIVPKIQNVGEGTRKVYETRLAEEMKIFARRVLNIPDPEIRVEGDAYVGRFRGAHFVTEDGKTYRDMLEAPEFSSVATESLGAFIRHKPRDSTAYFNTETWDGSPGISGEPIDVFSLHMEPNGRTSAYKSGARVEIRGHAEGSLRDCLYAIGVAQSVRTGSSPILTGQFASLLNQLYDTAYADGFGELKLPVETMRREVDRLAEETGRGDLIELNARLRELARGRKSGS